MDNKSSGPIPVYHLDLSNQLEGDPPGPSREPPTTNILIFSSQINYYLEGANDSLDHNLERADLTGRLLNPVTQVTGVDATRFPIIGYSTGPNSRPEFLIAQIRPNHIGKGENTSANRVLRDQIRGYGDNGDQAGHILGNQFGGSMRYYNLYPQNPSVNTGHWRSMEKYISKWLRPGDSYANIEYQARLTYDNNESLRPNWIHFLVKFKVGNRLATTVELNNAGGLLIEPILFDTLPNPPSNEHFVTIGEDYLSR